MNIRLRSALILLLACCVAALPACRRAAPEQRLRDTVAELQQAIDGRDAKAVEAVLADDFVGNDGLDRVAVRRLAAAIFLQHREVAVRLGALDVVLTDADHATVTFTAAVSGGSGGLLPDSAQIYDVRTGWRLQDGDWRMTTAEWTPKL